MNWDRLFESECSTSKNLSVIIIIIIIIIANEPAERRREAGEAAAL